MSLIVGCGSFTCDIDAAIDIAEDFQDSVVQPELFDQALEKLAAVFRGSMASTIVCAKPEQPLMTVFRGSGRDERLDQDHASYADSDLRHTYGSAHPGKAFSCRLALDERQWSASSYYRHVLAPRGGHYSLFWADRLEGQYAVSIAAMRSRPAPAFDRHEQRVLDLLAPHALRALRARFRLGFETGIASDLRAALDVLRCGVFLVDASCRVWFASQAAERLVSKGDGLVISHGTLRAATPFHHGRLEAVIVAAARAAGGGDVPELDGLSLPRSTGGAPLRVLCVPLRAQRLGAFPSRATAMLMVTDPDDEAPVSAQLLRRLYGITAAEARLCASLIRGLDLDNHAAAQGVSFETARSQLKSVFQKTGVSRQADLLRLILTGPAAQSFVAKRERDGHGSCG